MTAKSGEAVKMVKNGEVNFLNRLLLYGFAALVSAALCAPLPVAAEDEEEEEKPPADFIMKDTGKEDYVPYSHAKKHKEKIAKCTECHPKVFSQKIGRTKETKGALKMEAMEKGAFCGKCHNGTDAFPVKSPDPNSKESCVKCHSVKKDAAG
jgi:c(7)-type cytochrome triheme protein